MKDTQAVALLAALFVLLAGYLLRRRPFLLLLVLCCLLSALFGYRLQQDYSWHTRLLQQLPADSLVLEQTSGSVPGLPWTRWLPMVTSISILENLQHGLEQDDQLLVEFDLLKIRRKAVRHPERQNLLLNCHSHDLIRHTEDGNLHIEVLPASDPLLQLLCRSGA